MKSLIKKVVSKCIANDSFWKLLDRTILNFSRYVVIERRSTKKSLEPSVLDAITNIIPDYVVKHGVFKGMKYPNTDTAPYLLFPKLLGSYEAEIEPILKRICDEEYTEIVNIGCAEGYYAVGLALRIPSATVYAYDVNEKAIKFCKEMAKLNGVEDRLITGSFCDTEILKSIPFTKKGLIICDCEGCEKELFTDEIIHLFAKQDYLIELHDFIDITISSQIRERFEKTHTIEVIQSIDDIKKAQTYVYEELRNYDLETRKRLLGESRPAIMEWFYMKPRND